MPEDSDLEGVEFKAMASGSHTLLKDFVLVLLSFAMSFLIDELISVLCLPHK